jgi:hypothetical protein
LTFGRTLLESRVLEVSMRSVAAAALVLLVATPALAAVPIDGSQKVEGAVLRADRTTGRAWVEVKLAKRFLSGREARQPGTALNVAAPELSFDRTTGEITVASGDRRVTCATVDEDIHTTGACRIDATIEAVPVDTGFGIVKRDALVVLVKAR